MKWRDVIHPVVSSPYDSGSHTLTVTTEPADRQRLPRQDGDRPLRLRFRTSTGSRRDAWAGGGGFIGVNFGESNPSTLDVQ
jgi:hypothetical protein